MAYYNFGFGFYPNRFVLSGFDGGFNQIPSGYIDPSVYSRGQPRFFGDDLPSVDPFNYPGIVHFGPSFTILGPHPPEIPPGAGIFDPYLMVPGAATLRIDSPI